MKIKIEKPSKVYGKKIIAYTFHLYINNTHKQVS